MFFDTAYMFVLCYQDDFPLLPCLFIYDGNVYDIVTAYMLPLALVPTVYLPEKNESKFTCFHMLKDVQLDLTDTKKA